MTNPTTRKFVLAALVIFCLTPATVFFLTIGGDTHKPTPTPVDAKKTPISPPSVKDVPDDRYTRFAPIKHVREIAMDLKNQKFCINLITGTDNHLTKLNASLAAWGDFVEKLVITSDSMKHLEKFKKPNRHFVIHGSSDYKSAMDRFFVGMLQLRKLFPGQCDFYMFADDDTFISVPNLNEYLKTQDPAASNAIGSNRWGTMSGGAGIVLSRTCYDLIYSEMEKLANGDFYDVMINRMVSGKCEIISYPGFHSFPPQLHCQFSEIHHVSAWSVPPVTFHYIRTWNQMIQMRRIYNTPTQKHITYDAFPAPPRAAKPQVVTASDIGIITRKTPWKYNYEFNTKETTGAWVNHWGVKQMNGETIADLEIFLNSNPSVKYIFVGYMDTYFYLLNFVEFSKNLKYDENFFAWNHKQPEAGYMITTALARELIRDYRHLSLNQFQEFPMDMKIVQTDGIFEYPPENYCWHEKAVDLTKYALDSETRWPVMNSGAFMFAYLPRDRKESLHAYWIKFRGQNGEKIEGPQTFLNDMWDPVARVVKPVPPPFFRRKQ